MKPSDYWELIRSDLAVLAFIVFGLLTIAAVYWHNVLLGYSIAIWFAGLDVLGFHWLLNEGGWKENDTPEHRHATAAYRIVQHGVYFFVLAILASLGLWCEALVGFVLWWTGFCDITYYGIGLFPLRDEAYTWLTGWLWIFPGGAIAKINKTSVSREGLIYNVLFGILVSIIILYR